MGCRESRNLCQNEKRRQTGKWRQIGQTGEFDYERFLLNILKVKKQETKTVVDEDGEPISEWNPDSPDNVPDDSGRVMSVELFYTDG